MKKLWIAVYEDDGENYVVVCEKHPDEIEWEGKMVELHEVELVSDLKEDAEFDSDIQFTYITELIDE